MKLILLGFPHTRFNDIEFPHCAFTAKAVRLVEMLRTELGAHVTVLWGGDTPTNDCDDYVPLLSDIEQAKFFGPDLPATILNLNWNPETAHWRMVNHRAAAWLHAWAEPGQIVMTMSGSNHDGLYHELPHLTWVEPCVGYSGVSMKTKAKVFESFAWMHHIYGRYGINDGCSLDAVIPNFYRPDDFHTADDQGYLLFIGRAIRRKGVEQVAQIARYTGKPLVIAGQGSKLDNHHWVTDDGCDLDVSDLDVHHVGTVRAEARAELYAGASCTLVPTLYIEPWGGVFAEAMLSGVWPVTTNWGGFTEWVPPECRISRAEDGAEAVYWAITHRGRYTDGTDLREFAASSFGLKTCAGLYSAWLDRLGRE
jgi:glycosyltransferase involved in cell wall biosynthesis